MLAFPFGEYRVTEQVLLAQCQREVYAKSERLEQFTDRTNSGYERLLYVHEDLQGNTRYYTKDNGQSFAELTYDAWGMPESPNKLLNNDHGNYVYATYTGHIFDTTLDIYFAEARFYDAQTRQWLAMDPIKDGGNWYQYCYSNPLRYWDPLGLAGFTLFGCTSSRVGISADIEKFYANGGRTIDLMAYLIGDTMEYYEIDNPNYKSIRDKLLTIVGMDSSYAAEIDNFAYLYHKYEYRYQNISDQTGVPAELIAAIHYHEAGATDFDVENGIIYFNVYLHNGQELGKVTTIDPQGVYFSKGQFDEAAMDALEGKPWSAVENIPSERFKANNLSAYNIVKFDEGNYSMEAMLTFANYFNGMPDTEYVTYVFNGAIDSNGNNVGGVGKYTKDGQYDATAKNDQPGIYLLLDSIVE